jgi:hypothetical protein
MADLKSGSTSYPTSVDTATAITAGVDSPSAAHINGPAAAIVAVENELGTGLKGAMVSLAARLAVTLADDGGLLMGTSFPVSPPLKPHFFWRSDQEKMYAYDTVLATYIEMATSVSLTDYVSKSVGTTVTAVHQFNPAVAGAPFTLGANAVGQKVVGLDADTVDGKNPGSANGVPTLDANTRVVESVNLVWDGTAGRSASPTAAANKVPVRDANGDIDLKWASLYTTNAGALTIGTTTTDCTVPLNLGSPATNARYFVWGTYGGGTKGASAGRVKIAMVNSGTALITSSSLVQAAYTVNGVTVDLNFAGIVTVTTGGTLTINMQAISDGSTTTGGTAVLTALKAY